MSEKKKKSPELVSTMRVDEHGVVSYVLEDGYTLHRDGDKPAKIDPIGVFSYWKNGKLHRNRGPAVISHDGSKSYYRNGEWLMSVRADGEIYVRDSNGDSTPLGEAYERKNSTAWIPTPALHQSHDGNPVTVLYSKEFVKKFTDLVVKEALNKIQAVGDKSSNDIPFEITDLFVSSIKHHFKDQR